MVYTMTITTNGWTIYAPVGTTLEQIAEEFEKDPDLWSKVTGSKVHPYRGQTPRDWVFAHSQQHIVHKRGRNEELIKEHKKTWSAERVVCECGRAVTRGILAKHRTTAVHLRNLAAETEH